MLANRYRFYFSRDLPAAFISHLDMTRLFERLFRRLDVKLKFTQGFNPHPKIVFILPMPVGLCSKEEIFEVECEQELESSIIENLNKILPEGLKMLKVELATDKIQVSDMYYQCFVEAEEEFCKYFDEFMKKSPAIKKEKEGKVTVKKIYDFLLSYECEKVDGNIKISFHINVVNGSYIKPEDILREFCQEYNIECRIVRVERVKVNYKRVI
ncbi:TIGR03936 family radical SAM-associated protein [Caldicellulosiruptor acetigenus]|uniref:TIGR03936 family radical SAM-associated protein n=1 Tax=Caldicellulosiruptor acetigenus TaxID=301953 RepID=UPI000492C8AA|nr:TIGR03936 family radical SAM-associated protein [Caldicellulosiruptor acetigenus]WAM36814.1 TIGR03936 family radical SAM-associated protein [Caldicellulosiruptor acetigenus]